MVCCEIFLFRWFGNYGNYIITRCLIVEEFSNLQWILVVLCFVGCVFIDVVSCMSVFSSGVWASKPTQLDSAVSFEGLPWLIP